MRARVVWSGTVIQDGVATRIPTEDELGISFDRDLKMKDDKCTSLYYQCEYSEGKDLLAWIASEREKCEATSVNFDNVTARPYHLSWRWLLVYLDTNSPKIPDIWNAWADSSIPPFHIKEDSYPEILIDGSPGFPTWLIIVPKASVDTRQFIKARAERLFYEYRQSLLQERLHKLLHMRYSISQVPELYHDKCMEALALLESTLAIHRKEFSEVMEGSSKIDKLRSILQQLELLDSDIEGILKLSARKAVYAPAQEALYNETCKYAVNLGGEQLVEILGTAPRPSSTLSTYTMVQSRRQAIDQLQSTVRTMVEIETAKFTKSLNVLVIWGAIVSAASLGITIAGQKLSFKNLVWTWWVETPSRWFGLVFFLIALVFLFVIGRKIGLGNFKGSESRKQRSSNANHPKKSVQTAKKIQEKQTMHLNQTNEKEQEELNV